jgi:hypothetical protein
VLAIAIFASVALAYVIPTKVVVNPVGLVGVPGGAAIAFRFYYSSIRKSATLFFIMLP